MLALSYVPDTPAKSHASIDALLEQLDDYIRMLAYQHIPRQLSSPSTYDLDASELAQMTRIKLWQALQRGYISNTNLTTVKAYTRTIVRNESVNMLRQHKHTLPLPIDDDGELFCGQLLTTASEGMQDPSYVLEQQERLTESAHNAANAIEALPNRQRTAMLCELKDHIDDILPMLDHFKTGKTEIATVKWPQEKKDVHSFKASLSISRKKLHAQLYAVR
jgi:RNA polymerase sigma factor (sigma-70 family)